MTDPKLVEKAREVIFGKKDCGESLLDDMGLLGKIERITNALQSHGDEVRRKTVEEAVDLVKNGRFLNSTECNTVEQMIAQALLKLLEVKNA